VLFLGLWIGDFLFGGFIDTVFNSFEDCGYGEAFLLKFIFGLSVSCFFRFELYKASCGFIIKFMEICLFISELYKSFYSEGICLN